MNRLLRGRSAHLAGDGHGPIAAETPLRCCSCYELRQELLVLCALAPCIFANLRAQPTERLTLVDASDWGIAVVDAPLSTQAARELYRHVPTRAGWVKMLDRARAWQRAHDCLPLDEELPDGAPAPAAPLWIQLANSLPFCEVGRRRCRHHRHNNKGEIRAPPVG